MAFLVCYLKPGQEERYQTQAIYLDQEFYGMIFRTCIPERSRYSNLSVIASLRYKSPDLVIEGGNLDSLAEELAALAKSGHAHPQIAKLREVCFIAKTDGCGLNISGDMYLEL